MTNAETTIAHDDPDQAMAQALAALGVHADLLSPEERHALDVEGVLILEGHMSPALLAELQARFDEVVAENEADGVPEREVGAKAIMNTIDRGEVFTEIFTDPKLLAAASHVIGRPFKIMAMNGRSALPGYGLQGLHPDWEAPVQPGEYSIINSMWLIDDFTEDNGPTRVVPGSHRTGHMPGDDVDDPVAPHPRERRIIAPAGSIAIFNAHVWHGGTLNTTEQPRRVLHCAFVAREHPQQTVQRDHLSPETVARMSPAARWLLDV